MEGGSFGFLGALMGAKTSDCRCQLADVQAQLQALIDAGSSDTAALEDALATLADADATVDSIEAAPVVEPTPEPEPAPEPPIV